MDGHAKVAGGTQVVKLKDEEVLTAMLAIGLVLQADHSSAGDLHKIIVQKMHALHSKMKKHIQAANER